MDVENLTTGTRFRHVMIDSSARDTTVFPTPSRYDVSLTSDVDVDLRFVRSVKITDATAVPFSAFLVQESSGNSFVLETTAATTALTVPDGDYEGSCAALAAQINSQTAPLGVAVSFDAARDVFVFASTASPAAQDFAVDFTASKALAGMMGFPEARVQSAAGALRSTFRQGLVSHPYHNTIVMFIDGFDRVKSNNPAMHNAFCVLNKHTLRGIEQSCCFPQDTTKHEFRPKKLHISRLSVHFRDLYGRAYDFRGREHRFELRFEMCGTSSGPR